MSSVQSIAYNVSSVETVACTVSSVQSVAYNVSSVETVACIVHLIL